MNGHKKREFDEKNYYAVILRSDSDEESFEDSSLATKNLLKIPHCVRNDILNFIIVRIFFNYIELTLKNIPVAENGREFFYFWQSDLCAAITASVSPSCVNIAARRVNSSMSILQAMVFAAAVMAAVSSQAFIFTSPLL